jgi:arylsulfatase A-like enzyme/Flp pilus assembly protein TadD
LIRAVSFVVALASATACVGCRTASVPQNVLLVTLDTTRADRLGCYGYPKAATPVLDALAAESTLFEHAVTPAPITLPSHSTMMTGLNPYHHGVRYNGIHVLSKKPATLAERLGEAGFKRGAVVSSFAVATRFGLNRGFESYDDLFAEKPNEDLGTHLERKAADAIDRGIAWWNGHAADKRFLWVHLYDAHYPYAPPFPYSVQFADRPYDGEIASVDHELGRLFNTLKKSGAWRSTLVIVAGDHGEGLFDHGERWHANQVYESTTHVPFIIKAAGTPAPRRVREPVSLADIMPTVLDLAGLKSASAMDGVSLRGAIDDGRAPVRPIYFESIAGAILYGWSPLLGVRRGAMNYFEGARAELYDTEHDPAEADNLVQRDAARAADLRADLEVYRKVADVEGSGATGQPVLDDETVRQLASLGYVGGTAATPARSGQGAHPPDLVDIEQELLRAQTAVSENRWPEAADSLDFILKKDPTNRFALHFRSVAYSRQGDSTKAIELARALLKVYPDSPESTDLMGETLSQAGKPGEAAQLYTEALRKHGDNALLRYHLTLALLDAKRIDEAEAAVAELAKLHAGDSMTAVAQSIIAAIRGNVAGSLEALDRAVKSGFSDFAVVDASPWFTQVRKDPRYSALVKSAPAAKSAENTTKKPAGG